MGAAFGLRIAGLVVAAIILASEVAYYFAHQDRPGVSPHLIGLSTAVVLLAVAGLIGPRDHHVE